MKFEIKEDPLCLYIIVCSFYILFNGKKKVKTKFNVLF